MNPAESGIAAGTVLFGKYQVESLLGRGGMGLVYCARHLALDELVAIKVLRRDVALDEETVTRFVREAQSVAKLKSEHVARVTDVGTFEDGLPYMVMEFLQGADLGQMIEGNGAMPVSYSVDLLLQACDALAEAHSLGIVHRDIKPTNLFVSQRPDQSTIVKVLDFGISKSAGGTDLSLTQTSSMLGTPAYMSPEQMRSARTVDVRSDLWSLGTVLYELVEGRRPFAAESFSEMCVMVAIDPPIPMVRGPSLEPLLHKCLAKNPDDRYANVAELTLDLAMFAGNPDAAHQYVTRAHRVLGLSPPDASDSRISPPPTYATPVPGISTASMAAAMAAASTAVPIARRRRSPKQVWIALAAVALGVVGAFGIMRLTKRPEAKTGVLVAPREIEGPSAPGGSSAASSDSGVAMDNPGSTATGNTATGNTATGNTATGNTATGNTATGNTATGSSATAASAGTDLGGAGSAGATTGRGSGATPSAGSGKLVTTRPAPKLRPKPNPKPLPPHSRGSAEPQTGSGAGSAKPPCDPFSSRRGC